MGDAVWSPTGDRIAYAISDSAAEAIVIRSLEGGREHRLATTGPASFLRWSRDGKWIAYFEGERSWMMLGRIFGNVAPSAIRIVDASGGEPVAITSTEHANVSPAWLPDGRLRFSSPIAADPATST